jgi:tetraacyldisaccharide 4'-kinase
MREPAFWWHEVGIAARLLMPAAAAYGAVAAARLARHGRRAIAGAPVVCIGNLTVGGAGKTPTAIAVAEMLTASGEHPSFLSRGYGGRERGPLAVDPARHRAAEVGDEPLLLARTAPTIVAHDRQLGARLAVSSRASVIVMDDGFQNPSLHKDFAIIVVDSRRGIGNGRVFPAGPLRAPLDAQLGRAHAMILVGLGAGAAQVAAAADARGIPVFCARLEPDTGDLAALGGGPVLAFAGIGDPEKFFTTLADAGVAVAQKRSFPDHHPYTQAEAKALCAAADHDGLVLVTTEKDYARLVGNDELKELARRTRVLPVSLSLDEADAFKHLMLARLRVARMER